MAAAKSKAIEKDVDGLISSITGFSESLEEDQENFELCRRYVLSNIYYHRYLDTNSHEVRRQLHGLATKFRVHAMPGHADRLETLWKKLVERSDWSEHAQWDIEWRLLSLLVNLGHNPTAVASKPRPAARHQRPLASLAEAGEQQEQEREIDWQQELRLPEEDYSPYQSPEEWSDLDDDADINISPPPVHVVRFSRPSLLLPGVEVGRTAAGRPQPLLEEGDPLAWIEERISRPYQPLEPGAGPLRPSPDAAETYHALQVRLGLAGPTDLSVLSEWSVCREVVWQLLCPADSSLLQWRGGQYRPTGRFRVHGLTQAALSSQLSRLCVTVTAVSRLRAFIQSPGQLSTHLAFASSLTAHLQGLDAQLVCLETELQKQEVTLTLRGLQRRLSAWIPHLAELDGLLCRGVLSFSALGHPGWVRTARLVSVLYEAVELCADQRWSAALVRLFLDTVQPLLAIVNGWTVLETDPDPGREFLIQRDEEITVTDARYWDSGFTVHSDLSEWWTDGVEPLPFLLPHLDHVVQTAKCLRILCHLKLTDDLDDSSLQEEFNRLVSESLSRVDRPLSEEDGAPTERTQEPGDAPPGGSSAGPTKEVSFSPAEPPSGSGDVSGNSPEELTDPAADRAAREEGATAETASSDSRTAAEGAPVEPEGAPVEPEGAPIEPEGAPGEPEGASSAQSEEPGASAADPSGKPEEPPPEGGPADPPSPDPEGGPDDPVPVPEDASAAPEGALAGPPPDPEGAPSEADSGRGSEGGASPPPSPPAAAGDPSPDGMLQELLSAWGSSYLSAAFGEVLQTTERAQSDSSIPDDRAAPPVRLTTCMPHVVCSALAGPLASRQATICRRMVAALRSDYRLGEHLRMLRRVLLMEAGDLMAQFTQQLCTTLTSDSESDESVTLTLGLEDCVSVRYPEQAARLSVSLQHPAEPGLDLLQRLETVTLGYSVPWPCTIVITERCISRYNAMFRFILQLKFTLRSLQTLRFEDLTPAGGAGDHSESSLDLDRSAAAPRASRVLRLQLLRAWLLHFVGNIHSYIMMRVLHSTWLELEERLEKATDVDSMVQMHELYLDVLVRRCLLSGSAERTLHAAVLSALQLAGRLCQLWTAAEAGQPTEEQLVKLEADYVRCHHFTAGLLRQYRQAMGHVDSLAAAMAHSAPGQVSYEELV